MADIMCAKKYMKVRALVTSVFFVVCKHDVPKQQCCHLSSESLQHNAALKGYDRCWCENTQNQGLIEPQAGWHSREEGRSAQTPFLPLVFEDLRAEQL